MDFGVWIVIGCMVGMFCLGSGECGQQQFFLKKKNMDNRKLNLSRTTVCGGLDEFLFLLMEVRLNFGGVDLA